MQPVPVPGPEPALRFPLGLLAAVVATLVMDQVVAELPEGETPPRVAAGVLTGSSPEGAPDLLADVVHYVAAGLTGPLFVWLLYAGEYVLGEGVTTTAVASVVLLVCMIGFFVGVVLPRASVTDTRRRVVGRDWALSALVYVVVLVPVVAAGSALL